MVRNLAVQTGLTTLRFLSGSNQSDAATAAETESRHLANSLYGRVDWYWAEHDHDVVALGCRPECGFLNDGLQGYNEALVLYVLGIGSSSHPVTDSGFKAWTVTYPRESLYGIDLLVVGHRQAFVGYAARRLPRGPDNGTITGPSMWSHWCLRPRGHCLPCA